jgi:predicted dehydrogenase
MSSDGEDITRREFVSRTAKTAAGLVGGAALGGAASEAAPRVGGSVLNANDRVVLAVIGIRGQGNALKRGFASLDRVEIKTLCDVDANLFPSRVNDTALSSVPRFKPGTVQDMRRVFEDKDIDGVVIATPNHWHALATIWAVQAGKHVFVEKPPCHNVFEGRKMVEAARKYDRIVQTGTMNRSRPAVQAAIRYLHEGGIGDVYMARGLCFKPRPSIGRYPDGLMKPGERYRLNVEASDDEPTYDEAYFSKVDYDLWLGPAPKQPFNRNRFHYNWHWHWDYGNADTGNQGPHQYDIARWGMRKDEHPVRVSSLGGLYAVGETSQETPNVVTSLFEYADGKVLEFAARGTYTNDEGTQRIGNLFYGTKGWLWIDGNGRSWQSYLGRKDEKGPGMTGAPESGSDPRVLTSLETPHYQNFVDAIRAGDRKKLACDIEEGVRSSLLHHIGNIAYRVGRRLEFDGGAEKFVGDEEANRLLTREYRAPFVVPEKV